MTVVPLTTAELARSLEAMAIHLRRAERGVLLIAAASEAALEGELADMLEERLAGQVSVIRLAYSPQQLSLPLYLRSLPPPPDVHPSGVPHAAIFAFGLDELSPQEKAKAMGALNLGRERLRWAGYAVVLWVRPQTVAELQREAPDFCAWHSGLFAFALPEDEVLRAQALAALRLSAPAPVEELRRRYLEHLAASYRWLDFRGLLQVRNIVRLKLEDIYIPLWAAAPAPRPDPWAAAAEMRRRQPAPTETAALAPGGKGEAGTGWLPSPQAIPVAKALAENRRMVVLGDPGSGKSTLLKYLALAFAEGEAQARVKLHEERLPILLPILAYAAARRKEAALALDSYLPQYFLEEGLGDLAPLFSRELPRGRCLVLLDGLDEVMAQTERLAVLQEVERLYRRYPANRFVLTSRIAGYQPGPLADGFAHFTLQPFGDEEIKQFAIQWSRAYEAIRGWTPQAQQRADERAANLLAAITANPAVQRLAANPLLLTILALIHYLGTRLPHRRVELYRLCVEALAETWNLARSLSRRPIGLLLGERRLDERYVVSILARIAHGMHLQAPSGLIPRPELERMVAAHFATQEGASPDEAQKLAHDFVELVREQSGLLVERGLALFGFMHLSFQEYLAARFLADRRDTPSLVLERLHDPRWQEVILLTAGVLSGERAEDVVRAILKARSPYEDLLHRDLLMAGRCLADDVGIPHRLRQEILESLLKLWRATPYRRLRQEIEGLLAALRGSAHEPTVVGALLRALGDESPGVRMEAAEALGRLGAASPEVIEALLRALGDKEPGVRRRAAEALGRLGAASPEVVQALLAALRDEDPWVRRGAAEALGRLGLASEEVIEALLRALGDREPSVQGRAAEGLGRLGAAPPEAVAALLRALGDENPRVRRSAAVSLGRLGAASQEAVEALLRALGDEDDWVRLPAVWALGRLGAASPEAVAALLRALGHRDPGVQSEAAGMLGWLGVASPEVVEALLRALGDKDDWVRESAAGSLGRLGAASPEVVEALLRTLEDKEPLVRWGAAGALGRLGPASEEVARVLRDRLDREKDTMVENALFEALWAASSRRFGG